MTMNKKKIVIIISILLVVSCNRSPLKNIFKQEVLDSVRSYIEKDNFAHDSYLILQTEKIFHENKIDINNGFIIGPLYENLYPDSEQGNYIELLKYKNKTVYIQFFNASFIDSLYHARTVIYCRQDSFCIYKNVYSHNPIMNYLKRASLIYYKKGKLLVRNDIDSLYLPKLSVDNLE